MINIAIILNASVSFNAINAFPRKLLLPVLDRKRNVGTGDKNTDEFKEKNISSLVSEKMYH